MSAVVITRLTLQASPMIAAAAAFSPARRHHHHEVGAVDLGDQILGAAGEVDQPALHREALVLAAARRRMPTR